MDDAGIDVWAGSGEKQIDARKRQLFVYRGVLQTTDSDGFLVCFPQKTAWFSEINYPKGYCRIYFETIPFYTLKLLSLMPVVCVRFSHNSERKVIGCSYAFIQIQTERLNYELDD